MATLDRANGKVEGNGGFDARSDGTSHSGNSQLGRRETSYGRLEIYSRRGEPRYTEFDRLNIEPVSLNDLSKRNYNIPEYVAKDCYPIPEQYYTKEMKALRDELRSRVGYRTNVVFLRDRNLPGGLVAESLAA